MKNQVFKALTNDIVKTTTNCTNNQELINLAFSIREKFNVLNDAFLEVHQKVSHSRPVPKEALPEIQNSIDHYLKLYRRFFPQTVIPKQHMLEKHCVPWMEMYGFGM